MRREHKCQNVNMKLFRWNETPAFWVSSSCNFRHVLHQSSLQVHLLQTISPKWISRIRRYAKFEQTIHLMKVETSTLIESWGERIYSRIFFYLGQGIFFLLAVCKKWAWGSNRKKKLVIILCVWAVCNAFQGKKFICQKIFVFLSSCPGRGLNNFPIQIDPL